jgi:hypothetical protein
LNLIDQNKKLSDRLVKLKYAGVKKTGDETKEKIQMFEVFCPKSKSCSILGEPLRAKTCR